MAWSDAARAAALEVRRRNKTFKQDNPGGSWLRGQMWRAARQFRAAQGRGLGLVAGATTATVETRLPAKLLTRLPGIMGEHLKIHPGDAKVASMAEVIRKRGAIKFKGRVYKPFINVNYRGQAFINEGNHRVRAYAAAGKKSVPVQISYFAGGELRRGPASLVTIAKYNSRRRGR
jgi:hypothetical protein